VVFENFDTPCGGAFGGAPPVYVEITLWGAGRPIVGQTSVGTTIIGTSRHYPDESGIWSCDLVGNEDIIPDGTTYQIKRVVGCDEQITFITVPVTGGPFVAGTLEDDPMNSITPSSLSVHASNLELHGGGLELAYAEITSNVVVTGSGAGFGTLADIPGLIIAVPDLARPIYLEGKLQVSSLTGTVSAQAGIAPDDPAGNQVSVLNCKDAVTLHNVTTNDTEPYRIPIVTARLPPHSPGNYVLAARRFNTPFGIKVIASSILRAWIRAVAA
jgi:hypothetical protein